MNTVKISSFIRRHRILLIVCICLLITVAICVYLFMPIPLSSEEARTAVKIENGIVYVFCNLVEKGMTESGGVTPTPIKYDFENDLIYFDIYVSFSVTRWSILFDRGSCKSSWRLYTTGEEVDSEGYSTVCDDHGVPHNMNYRYGRIFYWHSEEKEKLLWDGGFYK